MSDGRTRARNRTERISPGGMLVVPVIIGIAATRDKAIPSLFEQSGTPDQNAPYDRETGTTGRPGIFAVADEDSFEGIGWRRIDALGQKRRQGTENTVTQHPCWRRGMPY